MSTKYICPICKKPILHDYYSKKLICSYDGFRVDLVNRKAYIGDHAPQWSIESMTFLSDFQVLKPLFVLAPADPFTSDFKLSSCIFFACEHQGSTAALCCALGSKMPNSTKMKNLRLIAAKHNVAKMLAATVFAQQRVKVDILSVMSLSDISPTEYLFNWCVEESVLQTPLTSEEKTCVNLYFSPTAEEQFEWYRANKLLSINVMTHEQILFMYAFGLSDFRKPWACSSKNMESYVEFYLHTLALNGEHVSYNVKEEYKKLFSHALTSAKGRSDEFMSTALSAKLSTFMNEGAWFDIESGGVNKDLMEIASNITSKDFVELFFTYKCLGSLISRMFSNQLNYGLRYKKNVVCNVLGQCSNDPDEIVYKYWQCVKEVLKDA